jgi:hypothetical protein
MHGRGPAHLVLGFESLVHDVRTIDRCAGGLGWGWRE